MNRNILYAEYGKAFRFTHLLRGATPNIVKRKLSDLFQSTFLLRGATAAFVMICVAIAYFNPRTSCEVRRQNYTKEFIFSSTKLFSVKFCVQALTSKLAYIFKTSKTITFSNANLTEKYVHFHFAISSRYLPADIHALHQILLFSFHNYFLGNKNANYLFPD